ncbi:MAG: hypothetical protein SGI72_06830 [Planctomycetota bacterium]|nr:hypothetical protein [Planctomycetota bacterium]
MNRTLALFVALVTLVAHTLAIHSDVDGTFAFPYDQAYAGFRLARNLVFEGQMTWNPGMSAFESAPSMLWVLVCALGERIVPWLHVSLNTFIQTIGFGCMLLVVAYSGRFRSDRIASLLAPGLLATSGCVAAAAANGIETALFTLFALAAFLALERGYPWRLGIALSLLVLTRPDGIVIGFALFALRLFGKPNDDEGERPTIPLGAFVLPTLVFAVTLVVRWRITGFVLPPIASVYLAPHEGQWQSGVLDLRDFMLESVSPLLLVVPAWYLVRGSLSRTGAHAVFVALVWTVAIGMRGRGQLPLHESMVPALPFVFLGVQEGLINALDSISRWKRRVAIGAVIVCSTASVLASMSPGDLGPIPFGRIHRAWMKPTETAKFDAEMPLGRLGLADEIARTGRLRHAGLFFRDKVEAGARILTPWPGAIGYLSRQPVYDVLGRTDPLEPLDRPRTWSRRERADIVALLAGEYDYIVPRSRLALEPLTRAQMASEWLVGLDEHPSDLERLAQIDAALAAYELITVPIHEFVLRGQPRVTAPFHLLRARRLDLAPRIEMRQEGGFFRVVLFHKSHPQLADLHVSLVTADDRIVSLRPTCEASDSPDVDARTGVLLYDTGSRGVELVRGRFPKAPEGTTWKELRAVLRNPGSRGNDPFALVSSELRTRIE